MNKENALASLESLERQLAIILKRIDKILSRDELLLKLFDKRIAQWRTRDLMLVDSRTPFPEGGGMKS
jgi:hypothetical protein